MISTALSDEVVRDFLVERFDDFLSLEHGSAERTREAYQRDVLRLATYAVSRKARRPEDLTPAHLRDFVYHLKDVGLAPSSIRRTIDGQ
jgi:integrase/recombinase XerD